MKTENVRNLMFRYRKSGLKSQMVIIGFRIIIQFLEREAGTRLAAADTILRIQVGEERVAG